MSHCIYILDPSLESGKRIFVSIYLKFRTKLSWVLLLPVRNLTEDRLRGWGGGGGGGVKYAKF